MNGKKSDYTFDPETIENAELAVASIIGVEAAATVVNLTLTIAGESVASELARADSLILTSMGASQKLADGKARADEILSEVKGWYAEAAETGGYDSALAGLGRLLSAQVREQFDAADDDRDQRSLIDKYIVEFDNNAGLSYALGLALTSLAEARAIVLESPDISAPTRAKLQRVIGAAGTWTDGDEAVSEYFWDTAGAARAGVIAGFEHHMDTLGNGATVADLRAAIDQWRDHGFQPAVPDIDRDIHVVLAQLVHDLDMVEFAGGVTAAQAMEHVRITMLTPYRSALG